MKGSYAPAFWIGIVGCGLVLPFILYVGGHGVASEVIAPVLVLIGGCILRFLVVNTDDRAPIPARFATTSVWRSRRGVRVEVDLRQEHLLRMVCRFV